MFTYRDGGSANHTIYETKLCFAMAARQTTDTHTRPEQFSPMLSLLYWLTHDVFGWEVQLPNQIN